MRHSESDTAGSSSAAATTAITMVMTAISGCRGRRVGAGADRTLADDDLIPALGLSQQVRPVRRTGVPSDVAALVVDRQADHAELLAACSSLSAIACPCTPCAASVCDRSARVVDPELGFAVGQPGSVEPDVPLEQVPGARLQRDVPPLILKPVDLRVSAAGFRRSPRPGSSRRTARRVRCRGSTGRCVPVRPDVGDDGVGPVVKHHGLVLERAPDERIRNVLVPADVELGLRRKRLPRVVAVEAPFVIEDQPVAPGGAATR